MRLESGLDASFKLWTADNDHITYTHTRGPEIRIRIQVLQENGVPILPLRSCTLSCTAKLQASRMITPSDQFLEWKQKSALTEIVNWSTGLVSNRQRAREKKKSSLVTWRFLDARDLGEPRTFISVSKFLPPFLASIIEPDTYT